MNLLSKLFLFTLPLLSLGQSFVVTPTPTSASNPNAVPDNYNSYVSALDSADGNTLINSWASLASPFPTASGDSNSLISYLSANGIAVTVSCHLLSPK